MDAQNKEKVTIRFKGFSSRSWLDRVVNKKAPLSGNPEADSG